MSSFLRPQSVLKLPFTFQGRQKKHPHAEGWDLSSPSSFHNLPSLGARICGGGGYWRDGKGVNLYSKGSSQDFP